LLNTKVKFSANSNSLSSLEYANPGVTEKFLSSLPVVNELKIKPAPSSICPKYKKPKELRHFLLILAELYLNENVFN
jgi:hypothetical protein